MQVRLAILLFLVFYGVGCLNSLPSILGRELKQGGLGLSVFQASIIGASGSAGPFVSLLLVARIEHSSRPRLRLACLGMVNALGIAGVAASIRWIAPVLDATVATVLIAAALAVFEVAVNALVAEVSGFVLGHLRGQELRFFGLRAWGSVAYAVSGPINAWVVASLTGQSTATSVLPLVVGACSFLTLAAVCPTLPLPDKLIGLLKANVTSNEIEVPTLDTRSALWLIVLTAAIALSAAPYTALGNNFLGRLPGIVQPDAYQTPLGLTLEILSMFSMRRLLQASSFGLQLRLAPIAWGVLYSTFAISAWLATPWLALAGTVAQGCNCSAGVTATLLNNARARASGQGASRAAAIVSAAQAAGGLVGYGMVALAGPRNQAMLLAWVPLWVSGAAIGLASLILAVLVRVPRRPTDGFHIDVRPHGHP